MKIIEMEELILSLIKFKEELYNSEERSQVNKVIRIVDATIDNLKYYRDGES